MLRTNMRRVVQAAAVAVVVVACDAPDRPSTLALPVAPQPIPIPNTPSTGKLVLWADTSWAYVGRRISAEIEASDASGNPVDSDGAEVTSSDASVAQVAQRILVLGVVQPSGQRPRELQVDFNLVGVGTTTITARLSGFTQSITFTVNSLPPPSTSLVVDSFYVVEQKIDPYLLYWPIMWLREPTGMGAAEVGAVEISIPTLTTGLCRGSLLLGAGASAYVDYVHDYLWSNDLFMISVDGTPAPAGVATGRLIIQDSHGKLGTIEATGPIVRGTVNPSLPTTSSDVQTWICPP
jgi:hypothetical protein